MTKLEYPYTGFAGFVRRVVHLPFSPKLWQAAGTWGFFSVFLPLACLAILVNLGLGVFRAIDFKDELLEMAKTFDSKYDPIRYESGFITVEGSRIVHETKGDMTLLIDPDELVPLSEIKTTKYAVVRQDRIIGRRDFRGEQTYSLSDFGDMFGVEYFRITSQSLLEWTNKWGFRIQLGFVIFLVTFGTLFEVIPCLIYALITAMLWLAFRKRIQGRTFGNLFQSALAISSITIVIGLCLNLASVGGFGCIGILLWPAILTLLGLKTVIRSDSTLHPPTLSK